MGGRAAGRAARTGSRARKKASVSGAHTRTRDRSRGSPSVEGVLAGRPPGSLILVIAEKPSVARDIARALGRLGDKLGAGPGCLVGDRYVVTWAVGHLLELCEPEDYSPSLKRWRLEDLPIIPPAFRLRPVQRTASQLEVVLSLLRSPVFRKVVNACDAGREGELIFRHLMEAAGSSLPVERLWVSAMTDEAILEGFAHLRDGREYERLEDAARCRSESDWLVGINATRGMTRKCGVLLSVGRVQTPTLAILAEREREIQAFVPEKYWQVRATFRADPGQWTGMWLGPEGQEGRLPTEEAARGVAGRVDGRTGRVRSVDRQRRSQAPPLLHDLTQLQREMNRRYGFSAARTLSLAQDLYEKYKVITYPRTDSRFLSGKVLPLLRPTLAAVGEVSSELGRLVEPILAAERLHITGRLVNDQKVRDHHAIIPTLKAASASRLKGDHLKVFEAVARRLVASLYPAAVFEDTDVVTEVEGEAFRSRGRVVLEAGWLNVEGGQPVGVEGETGDVLPPLTPGLACVATDVEVLAKETKPPPRYTEASLLQVMEGAGRLVDEEELQEALKERGIGTPATRAAIIERLIEVGYVERDRRSLVVTQKGLELVSVIPTRDLVSPALTGMWESKLRRVEDGSLARAEFMGEIRSFVERMVDEVKSMDAEGLAQRMRRTVGRCPRCGAEVVAGPRAYSCSRWKEGCGFYVWRTVAGRPLKPVEVTRLLEEGRTGLLRGFKSKAGRRFAAYLTLAESGITFAFPEKTGGGKGTASVRKDDGAEA